MDLEGLAAGKPRNGHVLVGKSLSLGGSRRLALFLLVFASLQQQVEFPGKPELLGHLGCGSRVSLGSTRCCRGTRSRSGASVVGHNGGLNGSNRGGLGALGAERAIARGRYPWGSLLLLLGIVVVAVPLKGIQLSQRLELLLESRNGMHSCGLVALELQWKLLNLGCHIAAAVAAVVLVVVVARSALLHQGKRIKERMDTSFEESAYGCCTSFENE